MSGIRGQTICDSHETISVMLGMGAEGAKATTMPLSSSSSLVMSCCCLCAYPLPHPSSAAVCKTCLLLAAG